ncbi:MAG: NAD(P)-dependent oxidoreductase [Pseudorhodoplanes sp.]|jgi:nucleoside-diphosphate-sugar epimerase|nr:NAD(P)-dependent oxidoreductase [Pseudorhodoplanes sp.]
MNIFLAGATGVVGRRLVVLLRQAGHDVTGTTRSTVNATALETLGARPAIVDVFDAKGLLAATAAAQPDVVIHQLTDLPDVIDPAAWPAMREANARLRRVGTRNLINACEVLKVKRVVAQSIAWIYAPGMKPYREGDALDLNGQGIDKETMEGVVALEDAVTKTPGIDGLVLRYGRFYGPGTWTETPKGPAPLHVDAAAQAALLALTRGKPGIYNVVEEDGEISAEKARRELGFDASFRIAS